ncbi:MAG: fumarate hydratase, partial [Blastochloris sp.]|nr:fumarate hydratase [Blastochloris sp.]
MPTPPFVYQKPFPLSSDPTQYRLLTAEHVSTLPFEGRDMLKVDPEALTLLARAAFH